MEGYVNITKHLDRVMPFEARYFFAKRGRLFLSTEEIAQRSGLTVNKVEQIACATSWGEFRLKEIDAFCKACNVDILRPHELIKKLKKIANGKIRLAHLTSQQRDYLSRKYEQDAKGI